MEPLPVTVDKNHLIPLGERLHSGSIELIRELVDNARDADVIQLDAGTAEGSVRLIVK